MQIMQLLQIVPQATPPNGTASEAPADPTADSSLFAALFAGLVAHPVEASAAAPLPDITSAAPREETKTGTTDESGATPAVLVANAAQAALVTPLVTLPSLPLTGGDSVAAAAPGAAVAAIAATDTPKTEMPIPLTVPLATTVEGEAKAAAPIPAPGPETASVQPRTPQPAPPAPATPPAFPGDVEVLRVALDTTAPKKEVAGKQPELPTTEIIPANREASVPAQPVQQDVRTLGPVAAYPDRIPAMARGNDHPLRAAHAAPAEVAEGEAPAAPKENVSGGGATLRNVEVIVKDEAGERQSEGNHDSGSRKESVAVKEHTVPTPLQEGSRGFESSMPTKATTTSEPSRALHDSVMAQVKEGIAARQGNGNGEITVRLNPVDLGELRINVRVVDQHVKVEVLAANSQVREILLNNLDSLKDNFSRQNLTMSGFDVSTGTGGQGFDQFFRGGREAGQGVYRGQFGGGPAADDAVVTAQASDYYYTDRRDNSLVDVRF